MDPLKSLRVWRIMLLLTLEMTVKSSLSMRVRTTHNALFSLKCLTVLSHFTIGEESDEFWTEMGGKADYAKPVARPTGWPRLFQCSEATGRRSICR